MTPTMAAAEEAAHLLGIQVFDLMWALRDKAELMLSAEVEKTRDFESPNFGPGRAMLRAAQACDAAWHEVAEAVDA